MLACWIGPNEPGPSHNLAGCLCAVGNDRRHPRPGLQQRTEGI